MLLTRREQARSGAQASCGPCTGDPWPDRADGGVLAECADELIQGIAGQVHDVEGIHDRGCVGEFLGGRVLKPGESIHRDDLDVLAPRVGLGGQPGFEDLFGATRDHVQESAGAAAFSDGRQVQDNGDVPVLIRGVAPHVFIHPDDTHAIEPCWIIDQ